MKLRIDIVPWEKMDRDFYLAWVILEKPGENLLRNIIKNRCGSLMIFKHCVTGIPMALRSTEIMRLTSTANSLVKENQLSKKPTANLQHTACYKGSPEGNAPRTASSQPLGNEYKRKQEIIGEQKTVITSEFQLTQRCSFVGLRIW